MNSLSKREKTLIYILICMIVVIGGLFLLVLPSFEKYANAKAMNDETQSQLLITKASVPGYTDLDENVKKVKKDLDKVKKQFYTEMTKEDLDQVITQLAVEHYLTPVNLSMGEVVEEDVINYKDFLANQNKKEEASEESKPKANKVKVYNVSLVVQGTVGNVQSLVNDANQTYSMKVASVQYSEQEEDIKQMTITFKIFMI